MTPEDMEFLVTRLENRLKRGWREFIRAVQDDNTLGELAAKISAGDISSLLSGVEDAAEKFALDINGGFVAAGQKTARWLDKELDPAIRFDITSDSAIEWMTEHVDSVVQWMVKDQQEAMERVISYARGRGLSDADIAAEVRRSIGSNTAQVDFVESYRTALETGDYRDAIDRALGDGRYDVALERADSMDLELADSKVDAMVDSYRQNWIERRGENVAEDEAANATGAGVDEMIEQAVENGEVVGPNVQTTWHHMHDKKVRSSHRVMDGQTVTWPQKFRSGDGNELRWPRDEDAPDDDTAGCRCRTTVSLLQ